jgi:hypothetical protein
MAFLEIAFLIDPSNSLRGIMSVRSHMWLTSLTPTLQLDNISAYTQRVSGSRDSTVSSGSSKKASVYHVSEFSLADRLRDTDASSTCSRVLKHIS